MTSGEIVVRFDDSMGAAAALRHAIALAQAAGVASRGEVVAGGPSRVSSSSLTTATPP